MVMSKKPSHIIVKEKMLNYSLKNNIVYFHVNYLLASISFLFRYHIKLSFMVISFA
jgi:hypothetical protein